MQNKELMYEETVVYVWNQGEMVSVALSLMRCMVETFRIILHPNVLFENKTLDSFHHLQASGTPFSPSLISHSVLSC